MGWRRRQLLANAGAPRTNEILTAGRPRKLLVVGLGEGVEMAGARLPSFGPPGATQGVDCERDFRDRKTTRSICLRRTLLLSKSSRGRTVATSLRLPRFQQPHSQPVRPTLMMGGAPACPHHPDAVASRYERLAHVAESTGNPGASPITSSMRPGIARYPSDSGPDASRSSS